METVVSAGLTMTIFISEGCYFARSFAAIRCISDLLLESISTFGTGYCILADGTIFPTRQTVTIVWIRIFPIRAKLRVAISHTARVLLIKGIITCGTALPIATASAIISTIMTMAISIAVLPQFA
jgi:hypothetical protein